MKALIIDSSEERHYRSGLLEQLGFSVTESPGIEDGLRCIGSDYPDLVIANESTSSTDDTDLVPLLRGLGDMPIIIVGAGDSVARVKAILQGADLYLSQPVNLRELQAHIQALMRRCFGTRDYLEDLKSRPGEMRDYLQTILYRLKAQDEGGPQWG